MTKKLKLTSLFFAISVMVLYPACGNNGSTYTWATYDYDDLPEQWSPITYIGSDGETYQTRYWIIDAYESMCSAIPVDPMGPPYQTEEYTNDDGSVMYGVRGWPTIQPNEKNSVFEVKCSAFKRSKKPYGHVVNTWEGFTLENRCNALDSCP